MTSFAPLTKALLASVMAIAVVGTAVVALRSSGDPEPEVFRLGGQQIVDARRVVDDADRAFLRAARREEASLHPNARCWFAVFGAEGARELRPFLRCGPVLHFGGARQRPWDEVPFRITAVQRSVELRLEGDPVRGRHLPAGDALARPDGAEPPPVAEVEKLADPLPPRVAPGEVATVAALALQDQLEWRRSGAVVTGARNLEVRLEELSRTDLAVRIGDGLRRPAAGEEFVVAKMVFRSATSATIEVVTGARRTVADPRRLSGSTFLVASVPVGDDARLAVTSRGLTQEVSLRTGERLATNVLLASPPRVRLDRTVERREARIDVGGTTEAVALSSFTVRELELTAQTDWLGSAAPGTAWLLVNLDGFSTPTVRGATAVRLDLASSFTVVASDGRSTPAVELGRPQGFGVTVYFAVPEQTRSGLLRLPTTFSADTSGTTRPLVYAPVEIPFALA